MSIHTINTLLSKTDGWDKDERYMATSDLCNELQKDIKIEPDVEERICTAILKLLDDQSNDVQSKAIQCLGILLKKVQEAQVYEICDKLSSLILDGKEELRDIYSIGLKTLIKDVPKRIGRGVAQRLIRRLLHGISSYTILDVRIECIDCLTDLLKRFGREIEEEHEAMVDVLMNQLEHEKNVIRKKSIESLGAAAVVLCDPLFNQLMERLLEKIQAADATSVRTLIQTVGTISRVVGYRLGRHLNTVVPLFVTFLGDPEDESQQTDTYHELRETCLQGFESFVLRCNREITPHVTNIITVAMAFMKYDPNYNYGSDEEDEMEEEWEDDDDEGYEDDGMDDEDDDTSWKVRRAAVKVIAAVIKTRLEMLTDIYELCGAELIDRFKEREENVRLDIMECFTGLVEMTTPTQTQKIASNTTSMEETPTAKCPTLILENMLPSIMTVCIKQLSSKQSNKTDKTKSAVFDLLKMLCKVVPEPLAVHTVAIIPSVEACLVYQNQSLKLDALTFLRFSMETQDPVTFQPFVGALLPLVLKLVREEWYKIIAEALRVVRVIITILQGQSATVSVPECVTPVYAAIMFRLEAHDIDQEIKECAIMAVGQLVASLGDKLNEELPIIEQLLMDRLRNEITRMPTLKALTMIAKSSLKIDLMPVLSQVVNELCRFLRQQSRPLKQKTLETLMALISSSAPQMGEELFHLILSETAPLIGDTDLHLTHLSVKLTVAVLFASPSTTKIMAQHIMPQVLKISGSPLLQGRALETLLDLLKNLVVLDTQELSFQVLYAEISSKESSVEQKQAIENLAHCLATLCIHAREEDRTAKVQELLNKLRATSNDTAGVRSQWLTLLTLGEVGQHRDLSAVGGLQDLVLEAFESPSEDTKAAAAYALGRMAIGNLPVCLPLILTYMARSRHHYLLLSALKEVLVLHATTSQDFGSYIDQVIPHLLKHGQSPEEGVRNMVAECLGALITMHADSIVPMLSGLGSGDQSSPLMQWTIASSLKYSMVGGVPHAILAQHLPQFLVMLHDADLSVRHSALQMCNAAVHHQPSLISPFLKPTIIPVLYETTRLVVKRVVDLGPFKQKVDDGLPLRKSALACISTVLDTVPEEMNVGEFMPFLETALSDEKDVQMQSHQILIKLCIYAPGVIKGSLDMLLDPLDKTVSVNKKSKDGQVDTEMERANDQIRSGLRAVLSIASMNDKTGIPPKFWEFMERIQKREKLAHMMEVIKAESS